MTPGIGAYVVFLIQVLLCADLPWSSSRRTSVTKRGCIWKASPAISSLDMRASRSLAQNPQVGVPDSQGSYYVHLADLALQSIREGRSTPRKQKVRRRHKVWNRVHKSQNLPLCYEHHVDMHVSQIRPSAGIRTKIPHYVCLNAVAP